MNTHTQIITDIRLEVAGTIEEIGQALGLLREAADDTRRGSIESGRLCADDAVEILGALEVKFSELTAKLAKYTLES
jgi:hypothetical protein